MINTCADERAAGVISGSDPYRELELYLEKGNVSSLFLFYQSPVGLAWYVLRYRVKIGIEEYFDY